jgi:AcrR family transcriptional regulator
MSIPVSERPLRRDAERNLARIVSAARDAFAEHGLDVPMEEVARRAGVGVGTVYRRFATKAELVDAVLEDTLAELEGLARKSLEHADPWQGFVGYVERVLESNAANRGLKDVVDLHEQGRERIAAMRARIWPLVARLVARAQEDGSLRPDFRPTDMPLIFITAGRLMEATKDCAPDLWRRFFGLLLDGLRAQGATPLMRPSLTRAEVEQLWRSR